MQRKIIKLGKSTLVFSIPSKWASKYGIKSGDELQLTEEGQALIVRTSGTKKMPSKSIDLSKLSILLKRIVAAQYIAGHNDIRIKVADTEQSRLIQQRAKDFIGIGVVSQGKDFIELKEISTTNQESFDPILKRVFIMLLTISDESEKLLAQENANVDYLIDMESNINNFTDYAMRILNKTGSSDYSKTNELYKIITLLELIADQYKNIISYSKTNKIKLDGKKLEVYKKINLIFRQLYDSYYEFSYESTIKAAKTRDEAVKLIQNAQDRNKSTKESIFLEKLNTLIDLIINLLGSVLVIKS